MITIGLEASRANKAQKTGTEWYAWHLLQEFKKLDAVNQIHIYYNQALDPVLLQAPENFYFHKLSWPFKKFWTHLRLGWELLIHPVNKFFATNAFPVFCRGEVTATIHDLGFLKNPELYQPLERIYQKISHNLAIARADKIITISGYTKDDIIRYFPGAAAKIKVIPLGWDQHRFRPLDPAVKIEVVKRYNLPEKYILYIGRIETKKNIQNLIRAFKLLKTDYALVLGGRPGNYGYEEIQHIAADREIVDKIKFLGYVDPADHPLILAAATLFVFPSKFEGFGIPILEAMGSGVPVVCSDIPALREVGEGAVSFFNPDDINDIALKLKNALDDSVLRKKLIESGLEKCRNFSWEKCAKETLDFILESHHTI
ncbi:MAG: hypothetical protein C3F02_00910 [Parcubacteria group bacterium]|nr:MAG: hypothetical protein C3F02_00910 [Parcubacteria group bacterium]